MEEEAMQLDQARTALDETKQELEAEKRQQDASKIMYTILLIYLMTDDRFNT